MRIIPGLAIVAVALAAFTGCAAAGGGPTPSPSPNAAAKPTKTATPTPSPTPAPTATPAPASAPDQGADPANPSGWLIDATGIGPIELGVPLDQAAASLPGYTVGTCPNPAVRFLRSDDASAPSLAIAAGADGAVALITLSEGTGPATAEGIRLGSTVAEAKATYPGLVPSQGFDDRYTIEGAPGFITFSTGQLNVGDGAPIFSISVVTGGLPPKELCG
ncbi:hypothetical protein ACWEOH_05810 [Agromyces sp. NPDC004153]